MSLVAYPDSEDDDQPPATQNIPEQRRSLPTSNELKRKRSYHNDDGTLNGRDQPNGTLPALPAAFHDLYSAPVRTFPTSDPSLHGGRQRQTPHVEGNWNTHVYLEWHPAPDISTTISTLVSSISPQPNPKDGRTSTLHAFHVTPLGAPEPLHISLSAPLTLRTPQRAPFLAALTARLQRAQLRAFRIHVVDLRWVGNREGSRWFLAAGVATEGANGNGEAKDGEEKGSVKRSKLRVENHGGLKTLLDTCNEVAKEWGLPELYVGGKKQPEMSADGAVGKERGWKESGDSSFHISLAWQLEQPESWEVDFASEAGKEAFAALRKTRVKIEDVKIKIGNEVHRIKLGARTEMGGTLFG